MKRWITGLILFLSLLVDAILVDYTFKGFIYAVIMNKALNVELSINGELVFSVFNRCNNDEEVEKYIASVVSAITYKVRNSNEVAISDDKILINRDHYERLMKNFHEAENFSNSQNSQNDDFELERMPKF